MAVESDESDDEYSNLPLWKKNLMKKRAEEQAQKDREKKAQVSSDCTAM